jgi:hypothetical protein
MNLPMWAVVYPRACSQRAVVWLLSNRPKPPSGGPLPSTPWLCEYWPVMSVARDGQHTGQFT